MATAEVSELRIEDLDHLGIIAGVIDRIGLVEGVNDRLGTSPDEIITTGQILKAMILNGQGRTLRVGFVSAPLYLFSNFFQGKACEHLLGEGIRPDPKSPTLHLNDDKLGRVLDKLFDYGLTSLFVELSLAAARREGVATGRVHLDSSSFRVHGSYERSDETAITITHGYSRDKRPDLKQFIVDLMVSGDSGTPLFLRAADGNESDQRVFAELIRSFVKRVELDTLFVADAALYSDKNLDSLAQLRWLSRVPETIREARELLESLDGDSLTRVQQGYRVAEVSSDYGGVKQRWVVIESESRLKGSNAQVDKRVAREGEKLTKVIRNLKGRHFSCEEDARLAVREVVQGLRYHLLSGVDVTAEAYRERPGRPRKGEAPLYRYRVKAAVVRNKELIARSERRAARFLLATNLLDQEALPTQEVLAAYLSQQVAERGFRFLKDPLFFTSSLFLKTPSRVASLAMVMGLCLLVYSLADPKLQRSRSCPSLRELRASLDEQNATVADQKGRPTKRPTLRWVFQVFQAVHLVLAGAVKHIHGLTEERKHILGLFSRECRSYYLLL